jgi:hypothetical protein
MASETHCIDIVDKLLTLNGLEIIYEKNKAARVPRPQDRGAESYGE